MNSNDDVSYELEQIKRVVGRRHETDKFIPTWLPLLGVILALLGLIIIGLMFMPLAIFSVSPTAAPPLTGLFLFFTGIALLIIAAIIGGLLMLYLVYLWLKRINEHFERVRRLYRNIVLFLEKKGYKDESRWIDEELRDLEYKMGGERSPILWAILVFFINILIWYVLHMVNDSLKKLDKSEYEIYSRINDFARKAGASGFSGDITLFEKVPKRDTILYIILSIITLGLFTIYWAYVATVDVNTHFNAHHQIEAELVTVLENLPSKEQ